MDGGFLRETPTKLPYPVPPPPGRPKNCSIWLHMTNDCNLKCSYCFVGEKTSVGMSREVMEKVARDIERTAADYGTEQVAIKFAGGEPTLSVARLEEFRAILLERMEGSGVNVRFAVLTNGTLISKRLVAFLKDTGTDISISLDGYGEAHDTFRLFRSDRGSWSIVSRNILKLLDLGIRPYIMATISQETCHSLPDLVRWIHANGLGCRLSVVRQPNGDWSSSDREREYEAMNARLAEMFDRAFAVLEDPSVALDLRAGFDLCELYFDRPTQGAPCGIGLSHLVIKPDGNMVSCPMVVGELGLPSSGDLFATTRRTFPYSPSDRDPASGEDDCRYCRWFGVCSGGCPITNMRIQGRPFTKSPLCTFYRAVIPRYLRFFGRKLLQAEQSVASGQPVLLDQQGVARGGTMTTTTEGGA